jgi:hypothetical protein
MLSSDADREAVVDRLRSAYQEGRLTEDELEERQERALVARRSPVLEDVLEGIPPLPFPTPTVAREPRVPGPVRPNPMVLEDDLPEDLLLGVVVRIMLLSLFVMLAISIGYTCLMDLVQLMAPSI